MRYETWKVDVPGAVQAKLDIYIQDSHPENLVIEKRPLVLICPGGGYEHVSVREAEPVALQFLTAGCHAAVLWYDVAEHGAEFPQHLMELAVSVAYLRKHAEELGIIENQILVAGFSAGGHLAASLGCFWKEAWLEEKMGMAKESYQPNGLILSYPVITSGEFAHRGSFVNVMGSKAVNVKETVAVNKVQSNTIEMNLTGTELEAFLSLEHRVTDQVPPVFMWHTFEDEAVPLENSLLFATALRKAGVSLEYHIFPKGGHGYSLANLQTATPSLREIEPQCEQWMDLCKNWIKYNFGEK